MNWLADLSFERKLRFAFLTTSVVTVIVACTLFLGFEYVGYRRNIVDTVTTLATVTANNSTAAVAFSDLPRARAILSTLRAEPQVVAAALCSTDGQVLVSFTADPKSPLPSLPSPTRGVSIVDGRVIGVQPVIEGTRWLGTLYVWASMEQMYSRMRLYVLIVFGVLGATFVLALFLATVLQRTITRPILELAQTAGAIAAGQDYSLRARQYGTDELGRLTAAFNAMLERTQDALTALTASEAQLRIVTDNASVFLAHCDRDYRFKFVNRPYADRFGRDASSVVGRRVDEVIGAEAAAVVRPRMEAAMRGERVEFETELNYADLGPRWMHVVYVPERSLDGEVVGFVAIINDTTQRKQIEQEVAHARDEAVAASRAKDDFLAALSHELRTPLNPVLLLASEAADDPQLPAEIRADFETVRKNVELEARLIDDLLDLTAITRGKLSLDRAPVELHVILRDALATVAPELERKEISLTLHAGTPAPLVYGDAVRLQQVFWNVLKNAVKFTPEHGRIRVTTTVDVDGGRAAVSITDSGIGLTPAELEHVFEAFVQGDHSGDGAHRFGGLGLGLAISRMVIAMHHGSIVAESAGRGHGATFTIELPVMPGGLTPAVRGVVESGVDSETSERSEHAPVSGQRRVLLVEDHVATRGALQRLLTRRHFAVTAAGTISDAREQAENGGFDLLISDVGLPDGSGYDLMAELRRRFKLPGIALTGYGMEQDRVRSVEAGFSAHLIKPVRVQALDAALADVLGQLDAPVRDDAAGL